MSIVILVDEEREEFTFSVPAAVSDPVAYALSLAAQAEEEGVIWPTGRLSHLRTDARSEA